MIGSIDLTRERDAVLSDDGAYRYLLWRRWGDFLNPAVFVMLNPSSADALEDDPTIRRIVGFAKGWGFGSALVCNLFAYRSTSPAGLLDAPDAVGPHNDRAVSWCLRARESGPPFVVCAWGSWGERFPERVGEVGALLRSAGAEAQCLGFTKSGQPRHPLYLPKSASLVPHLN